MRLRDGTDEYELQSLKNRLELLLLDIYRTYTANANSAEATTALRHKKEYEAASAYIEAHLTEGLTLERIARDNSMSVSKLKVLFHSENGGGAIAYIIDRKLERAKILLREEEFSVTETAFSLGFSSVHYFSRLFKKKNGISPTEWVNQKR